MGDHDEATGHCRLGRLDSHGAPRGLLFPASLVRSGEFVYITNLSLDLRDFGFNAGDSQWANDVKIHTIARIRFRIPDIKGLP